MSDRSNQEHSAADQEFKVEVHQPRTEQLEKHKDNQELELSPRDIEARAEKARAEAMHNAVSVEIKGKNIEKTQKHTNFSSRRSIDKKQLSESYKKTLNQVQSELSYSSRIFSKITHNNIIEMTTDAISNTVARPNAILAGAFFAFILTLLVYIIAKTIGYALSGFETIAAFIVGWLVGIIYDYLRILITGKKS